MLIDMPFPTPCIILNRAENKDAVFFNRGLKFGRICIFTLYFPPQQILI